MRKILGISLILLFLLSVTATAVSAQQFLKNAPPKARLDATRGDIYGRYMAPVGSTITLFDKSTGTITGKKWYVDGKLYSTSMAKTIKYPCPYMRYHTFQLLVGNGSGSRWSNQIFYFIYSY